jgi:pantoate--beta-alanine ligase
MKIFKKKTDLIKTISTHKSLSFVPTMGSFHKGHINLIKKAKLKKNKVIVSIFINPKQFNSKKDYLTYPKNFSYDLKILKKLNVQYVYMPSFKDVFDFKAKKTIYLDKFSKKLCGKFRKSHFKGVVNIVNRLVEIIEPKYIFLGKKDFQQLYLIKKHLEKNQIKTKIISCSTIREANGIACSSRNKNLKYSEKSIASKVYNLINNTKKKIKNNKKLIFKKNNIKKKNMSFGVNKIDYIELLDLEKLKKPISSKNNFNIFIAYYIGKTRLIDNI